MNTLIIKLLLRFKLEAFDDFQEFCDKKMCLLQKICII